MQEIPLWYWLIVFFGLGACALCGRWFRDRFDETCFGAGDLGERGGNVLAFARGISGVRGGLQVQVDS